MAANILNSAVAIKVSVEVIRAFVRMREALASHRELADKLAAMEEKYDVQFLEVFEAIKMLAEVREEKRNRQLGFVKDEDVPEL
jgi:hypothetical protein